MGTHYHYSSLAQEKTGGFWVNGKLFGRQSCHPTHDVENADFILFLGTNPWQSHGIPQARKFLKEVHRDPHRKMVVVDPWKTKTAELADIHLPVKPGRDAFLLSAMLGIVFQEQLQDEAFLKEHTEGFEPIRSLFGSIPADRYIEFAGLDPRTVRGVVREYAKTKRATIRADLGLEHTLHSTLNDYLGKLLFLVTGHFGRQGCNNLHPQFIPIMGHSPDAGNSAVRTQVTGMVEISKLFPPNILPMEIDTDHPGRIRGVVVDSMNPIVTGADTPAYLRAFKRLELLVVIDVSMTETAELAHYILPAATQYEKWEAAFFGTGVPSHFFHWRNPILKPLDGTLPEPEIYRRLILAMGETKKTIPLLGAPEQLQAALPYLQDRSDNFKALAAPILAACQKYAKFYPEAIERAGITNQGRGLGEALFDEIVEQRSGLEIGRFLYEDTYGLIRHSDGKVHLAIDALLDSVRTLESEMSSGSDDPEFPFVLSAGGRRSYNANTINRDPRWRRDDPDGALRIHPDDLRELGFSNGEEVFCKSRTGRVRIRVKEDPGAQPGFLNMPHGYGLTSTCDDGSKIQAGARANFLTSSNYCNPIAKTPYHKNIRVRLLPV